MLRDQIIQEINRNPLYLSICKDTAREGLAEDLHQEFLLALLSCEGLEEIYEKDWFNYFCNSLIKNLYYSASSTFYQKYRAMENNTTYVAQHKIHIPDESVSKADEIIDQAIEELEKLEWHDREIVKSALKNRSIRNSTKRSRFLARKVIEFTKVAVSS